jgi:hypothetical protein
MFAMTLVKSNMQALETAYLDLRTKPVSADGSSPVTSNKLEAIVRLAEARARMDLRQVRSALLRGVFRDGVCMLEQESSHLRSGGSSTYSPMALPPPHQKYFPLRVCSGTARGLCMSMSVRMVKHRLDVHASQEVTKQDAQDAGEIMRHCLLDRLFDDAGMMEYRKRGTSSKQVHSRCIEPCTTGPLHTIAFALYKDFLPSCRL